ncbi:MAG: VOC family protein [Cyclobacteriaceae bacterium]|nr:VOC family protein [Cyclobacteriaceae bacterium]
MKKIIVAVICLIGISFSGCTSRNNQNMQIQKEDTAATQMVNDMKSYVSIFEIPATDISRAIDFYQAILGIQIEKMEMPEMQMGIFPYEGQAVTGIIIQAEGYRPSADGVTVYLNGGDNLQIILDKVEKNGGKILAPKTPHADGIGFWAYFLDSEGNKMGLSSAN